MSSLINPCKVDFTRANGLALYKNSFWSIPVSVLSRENLTDTPVDLSGYTGVCCIKKSVNDDTPLAMPEVTISQDEMGVFIISLDSSLSVNIPTPGDSFCDVGDYYYQVDLIDGISQESYRALYGRLEVVPSVIDSDDNN